MGEEVADDRSYMEDVYLSMLNGWKTHLITGRLDIFVDDHGSDNERQIRSEIQEAIANIRQLISLR
ncbi:hypothetical protein GCM10011571_34050 [Marinithermofilum abyssi]|uniref:Uncharacterized protein n=1 Tax=Marinithermofilum abyssi TaxID=1571185 RepID=A0A8J2VJK1_9BACL|nr:hypothetical protein [Marinithermofilum abyssi]GGE29106.1 hypothetical protein GCM10011571_34050 [Marinithermofilum abyssi]